jgi:hypothetical protein
MKDGIHAMPFIFSSDRSCIFAANDLIMRTAVYDTYVLKKDGNTMHFDINVPEGRFSFKQVAESGREFLASKDQAGQQLSAEECRFCHIEDPGEEVIRAIDEKGYYILEFDDIPATLTPDPTRRQLIQHIRAHSPALRFADLSGKTEEELKLMIGQLKE